MTQVTTIPLSTRELHRFYKEWLAAAEAPNADDNDHDIFRNGMGLCGNLEMWLEEKFPDDVVLSNNTHKRLRWQFEVAGLDHIYPFGEYEYSDASWSDTHHKDEKRLAWVRARISDMENL